MPFAGQNLAGEEVIARAAEWARAGVCSPDVCNALEKIRRRHGNSAPWDLSSLYIVCLGASSEMGPLEYLIARGANIIAVDRPGQPGVWERLIQVALDSPGTLTLPVARSTLPDGAASLNGASPVKDIAAAAGCDLLLHTPEIAAWLAELFPGQTLCVGSYTYLDSDLFVRINVACDVSCTVCPQLFALN